MWQIAGRPIGLVLVTALIELDGVASLYNAVMLFAAAWNATPGAIQTVVSYQGIVVSAIVGVFFLFRGYYLWNFHAVAWLMTIVLAVVGVVVSGQALVVESGSPDAWIRLATNLLTILVLLLPRVRRLFVQPHAT